MWHALLDFKRNGLIENCIHGKISWFSQGQLLPSLSGETHLYARSLMKPLQMKVIAEELDNCLTLEEKALSLSSHSGEDCHIHLLKKILSEFDLEKLKAEPAFPLTKRELETVKPSKLYNTCSGKHAAIIKACQINCWSTDSYHERSHPYHKAYLKLLKKYLGKSPKINDEATDECNLPTISMSLNNVAQIYSLLACEKNKDWIWQAMISYPYLVGGKNRLDSLIMDSCKGEVLAKEGADGLLGLSILNKKHPEGLGIVIKLSHGNDTRAMSYIAQRILNNLGYEIKILKNPTSKQTAHVKTNILPSEELNLVGF